MTDRAARSGPARREASGDLRARGVRARSGCLYRGQPVMHPTHVPIVNRVYTPTADELAFDKGLLQAIGYFVIVLRVRSAAPRGDYAWPRGPGNLNATGNRANGVNITGADGSAFPTSCIGSP